MRDYLHLVNICIYFIWVINECISDVILLYKMAVQGELFFVILFINIILLETNYKLEWEFIFVIYQSMYFSVNIKLNSLAKLNTYYLGYLFSAAIISVNIIKWLTIHPIMMPVADI